ncbi:MAG: class I SAM-dependent methyltransferase, partial [Methylocella sp.]
AKVAAADDYEYLRDFVHPLPGWLVDYAAIRILDLLAWQEQNATRGPLLEIGIYHGRSLALMLRSALRAKDRVLALDTFQFVPLETVKTGLAAIADPESIVWLQASSTLCSSRQLLQILGADPRFISIDGSHECDDVFWDLRLAEEMLAPHGLVAVDDFMNMVAMGVNVGVNKFFATPRNLAPFAYTSNKLFLCRPELAPSYRHAFEQMVVADQIEPLSAKFRQTAAVNRSGVEQTLWGKLLVVVPG